MVEKIRTFSFGINMRMKTTGGTPDPVPKARRALLAAILGVATMAVSWLGVRLFTGDSEAPTEPIEMQDQQPDTRSSSVL